MKIFMLIVCMFIFSCGISQTLILSNSLSQTDTLSRKTGVWLFEIDSIAELNNAKGFVICTYVNDTLNGDYKVLDINEVLRFKVLVINGKREGLGSVYSSSGALSEIQSFSNDRILGSVFFDDKNRVYSIINFGLDGKRNGISTLLYNNGRKWIEREFTNGMLKKETYYYRNKNIKSIYLYNEDGILLEIKSYKRNEKI